MVVIQIYGVTGVQDALLVADLGADHVGVVVGTARASWDEVDGETAAAIHDALPRRVRRVVMTLSPDPDVAVEVATAPAARPDILHLVNVSETSTVADLRALRLRIGDVALMCTVAVRDAASVDVARRVADVADYLLLDTVHPETGVTGASGLVHDWSLSTTIVAQVGVPVVLAGGLGPENVRAAIETVRPWGVDSETRTSRADDRRRKDPERVRRFVAEVRAASNP